MLKLIYGLINLFDKKDKFYLFCFQLYLFFSSLFEVASFSSIVPFVIIISDPDSIEKYSILKKLTNYIEYNSYNEFVLIFGFITAGLIVLSNLILITTNFITSRFSFYLGMKLSHILYDFYIKRDYNFFIKNQSSNLIAKITSESIRLSDGVIIHLMMMNSKLFIAIVISVFIAIINLKYFLIIVSFLSISYLIMYILIKRLVSKIGNKLTILNLSWFKLVNESLNSIKELIIYNKQDFFSDKNNKITYQLGVLKSINHVLSSSPKFIVESIAFVMLIMFVIFYLNGGGDFNLILPLLTLVGVAGYKLFPVFQQVFYSLSQIKFNMESFKILKKDFENISNINDKLNDNFKFISKENTGFIDFINVSFSYNNTDDFLLDNISLKIKLNQINAIVGESGSGKTTFINILCGLISPNSGIIEINKKQLKTLKSKNWFKKISYVPQNTILLDDSIIKNVSFENNESNINTDKINKSVELANLSNLTKKDIYNNKTIGETGSKLSGGQIKKIGIARAIYKDAEIIVFDEPTSSFDNISELHFYGTIDKLLNENKTIIIITHKVDFLKGVKNINLFQNGKCVSRGSYDEIRKTNEFKMLSMLNNKKKN